ncbi:hypothetical protein [Streptomyces catenulae]|uniref:Uncharacterized protein n=1 Tax=Streptomyces catenulae TaxID=66875 RepID=A0ABV2YU86_9ACTN|nr:hypothetical protein [Streptomyces catenulae]
MPKDPLMYLARRDAYAAFLTASDAEGAVIWRRLDGRYDSLDAALTATRESYAATQAAFNVLDVEGVGPVEQARELMDRLRALHRVDAAPDGAWETYTAARGAFVTAARAFLARN